MTRLWAGWSWKWDSIPLEGHWPFFCKPSQTSPRTHSASYLLGTVDTFIKVKRLEQRADNSAPISASVINAWGHAPTAVYACLSTEIFLPLL